jgi:hypothetical protein
MNTKLWRKLLKTFTVGGQIVGRICLMAVVLLSPRNFTDDKSTNWSRAPCLVQRPSWYPGVSLALQFRSNCMPIDCPILGRADNLFVRTYTPTRDRQILLPVNKASNSDANTNMAMPMFEGLGALPLQIDGCSRGGWRHQPIIDVDLLQWLICDFEHGLLVSLTERLTFCMPYTNGCHGIGRPTCCTSAYVTTPFI